MSVSQSTVQCSSSPCVIKLQVESAPPNPEHFIDMSQMWTMFFVAAIVIFCFRRILKLFDTSPHE